jgi:hypothetical protein
MRTSLRRLLPPECHWRKKGQIMTNNCEESIVNKPAAHTTTKAANGALLTEAELDRVAAAGSKPSVSGGQIPLPSRPKP